MPEPYDARRHATNPQLCPIFSAPPERADLDEEDGDDNP